MIRLVVDAKYMIDLSKLAIFASSNPVSNEFKNSVLMLLKVKPMYIGGWSVYQYSARVCYYSGILATELGNLLLSEEAGRYVHLREMFDIAHKIFHNAVRIEDKAFQEAFVAKEARNDN